MKKLKKLAMIPAVILCACNADQTGLIVTKKDLKITGLFDCWNIIIR